MTAHNWLNLLAVTWFFAVWIGYASFARHRARVSYSLSSVLQIYRKRWMHSMLRRDNRIGDTALIAGLERQTTFLASTSIFVIAGLITVLASIEQVHETLTALPFFNRDMTSRQLQFKILLLLAIYVYAFFTLTWAVRQYGFSSILLGAAPLANDTDITEEERASYATTSAKVIDQAGHSYNYGLRAYYFSLSVLPWLFNTWLFILAATLTVAVLYRREFHSRPLQTLANEVRASADSAHR
ncbi:DUF599 domain-containing protein [Marinimicrobium sp. LS-A18]|jgi:uncharacterized membrane protein|uniref:DUF599 domain-containing protein n=1 Tax=Marinimicrobium sp. LS-A18 TaxID=1381596 RepID=UPI0004675DD4|nr:DUF599 domain-containing protein [Marinimicrobium sp. LS-A18]